MQVSKGVPKEPDQVQEDEVPDQDTLMPPPEISRGLQARKFVTPRKNPPDRLKDIEKVLEMDWETSSPCRQPGTRRIPVIISGKWLNSQLKRNHLGQVLRDNTAYSSCQCMMRDDIDAGSICKDVRVVLGF